MKHWLAAFRLKTLPLALGAIILGSGVSHSSFSWSIFSWAALTAVFLQILSNLANDYGDFQKGTDLHRTDRQLAGGHITPRAMLVAIILLVALSLCSGIYLLLISFQNEWKYWLYFLGIGIASIVAAITYTMGQKAYGYFGLGDVFVFIFFGLVGVLGTAFLYHHTLDVAMWLPALGYGSLCMGVLHVNNIRDIDKDILTHKITLAGKMGKSASENFQALLMVVAFFSFWGYQLMIDAWSFAPTGILVLGVLHISKLRDARTSEDYNAQLKMLSLGSLVVVLLFVSQFV